MMLHNLQHEFAVAVLSGVTAPLDEVVDPRGVSVQERLSIYRNNTIVSLTSVMAAAFPATQKILGEDFFSGMARRFILAHPPEKPQLLAYGGQFPDFISGFEPARHLPYLADVARLEWLRNEAYFAADAPVLAPDDLASLPQDHLAELRISLHPAVRRINSQYPVFSIWQRQQAGYVGDMRLPENLHGERVLVTRPAFSVSQITLSEGEWAFLDALSDHALFGVAAGYALDVEPDIQLQMMLARLLQAGALSSVTIKGHHDE